MCHMRRRRIHVCLVGREDEGVRIIPGHFSEREQERERERERLSPTTP
jgi:hypothetical protein